MKTTEHIQHLRNAVEQKVGRRISTPKDFECLVQLIFDHSHALVSVSTLKRIWGYVQSDSMPRSSSLTPLAQYVGYTDWDDFVARHDTTPAARKTLWKKPTVLLAATLLIIAVIITAVTITKGSDTLPAPMPTAKRPVARVLHMGQDCFTDTYEYLRLFNITGTPDTAYFQALPGLSYVYLWGPEYGNTTWHNEGDIQQLMPTITEYFTPTDKDKEYIALANEKLFYERLEKDELRITFMRDIVDSLYVFIGIYRMDRQLSTLQKFVWRRVSDSLDLGCLNKIEQLRDN